MAEPATSTTCKPRYSSVSRSEPVVRGDSVNFSSGEGQRFGLERGFLAVRDIYLLDEPTSNIDSINEAIILNARLREREFKTMVFVSPRGVTLAISDMVFRLSTLRLWPSAADEEGASGSLR